MLVIICDCFRSRHLRTPANMLIINLAASDFLMLIKMPVFIYNSAAQGPSLGYIGIIPAYCEPFLWLLACYIINYYIFMLYD